MTSAAVLAVLSWKADARRTRVAVETPPTSANRDLAVQAICGP